MSKAKKEFFKTFGCRPEHIDPEPNVQEMWNMIHNPKLYQGDLFQDKPKYIFTIAEVNPKRDPCITVYRHNPQGEIQQAFVFGDINSDEVLEFAHIIPEDEWVRLD